MPISDDFDIDYTNRRIYHVSGTTVYTVQQLYSWLMDDFDESGTIDDTVPMTSQTPTSFTLVNGWIINSAYGSSFNYLSGGSVQTLGWNATNPSGFSNGIRTLTFTANPGTVSTDIGKPVVGATSGNSGILLDYNNTTFSWWVRVNSLDDDFSITETVSVTGGTGSGTTLDASYTGEALWTNLYTIGTLESGTQIYVYQNGTAITPWWSTGHIDILVQVKTSGNLIDGGNLTFFAREYSTLYDHAVTDASGGGRIPVPLATASDVNNQTATGTVAGYSDITIDFNSINRDLNNGSGLVPYDVEVNCAGRPLTEVYEYLKYLTRRTSAITLNGIAGEAYETVDSTYPLVKTAPFGTFAGGQFFGAQGVFLINMAESDINNYSLIDSNGDPQDPPLSITISITGLAAGDAVGMFRTTGDNHTVDKELFSIQQAHSAGVAYLRVSEPIPDDTPASGIIRVVERNASNQIEAEQRLSYSSYSNANQPTFSQFNLQGTTNVAYGTTDTAYVPVIDTLATGTSVSVIIVYDQDRYVSTRVRTKGYLPFITKSQITNDGLTVAAIKTEDTIAD